MSNEKLGILRFLAWQELGKNRLILTGLVLHAAFERRMILSCLPAGTIFQFPCCRSPIRTRRTLDRLFYEEITETKHSDNDGRKNHGQNPERGDDLCKAVA